MKRDAPLTWPERFERNVQILEGYANGETIGDLAKRFHLTRPNVTKILADAGVDASGLMARNQRMAQRRSAESRFNRPRAVAMEEARQAGERLASIARRFGVSRQRVHQILSEGRTGAES